MRPIPDRLTPLECWPVHMTRQDIKVGRIKMTRKKCSEFTNRHSVGRPTYQGSTLPEDGHFDAEINNRGL